MEKVYKKYIVLSSAAGINLLAGLLYIWSIVSKGLIEKYNWTSTQASTPYTVAIIFLVLGTIVGGMKQDKKGPKTYVIIGGILIGSGLILSSLTKDPLIMILTFGILTGMGFGIQNGSILPPVLKWFPPDKKGLITGVVVGAVAFASVIYSPLIEALIENYGISVSFLSIGIVVMILIIFLAQFLNNPPIEHAEQSNMNIKTHQEITGIPICRRTEPSKMRLFYKVWIMFALSSVAGLMIIGHAAEIVSVQVGWDVGYLLVILIAVFNGLGRIGGGHLSDKIGRVRYMRWIISIQAINMLLFCFYGSIPLICVGAAITGICYGSNFAVFPAIIADYFGMKHFGANYGLILTAWGAAGLIGPMMAALIFDATGNYNIAYLVCGASLIIAYLISFKLKERKLQLEETKAV
jgi:MFS family permease